LVPQSDASYIESLLSGISKVKLIEECNMDIAIDLTSCAPGFIAAIFKEFVNSAVRLSNISEADAEAMVMRTLYGVSKLFCERNMSFDDTISRVAVKGGITEEGVNILKSGLPDTFDKMFKQTLSKRIAIKEMVHRDFGL
jgi:pyrroline-5-carboxylate reductase